jgi:1-acyl-sn-glycerol-3-phosphate acyltransferase
VGQGHIFIDRSNRQQAISGLKAAQRNTGPGVSIVIFPEGSRSRDGRLGQFKKGGFMMALDMGLPILPVSISGASKVLPGRSFGLLPGTITIRVHDPIQTQGYGMDARDRLMADVRATIASGLGSPEPS